MRPTESGASGSGQSNGRIGLGYLILNFSHNIKKQDPAHPAQQGLKRVEQSLRGDKNLEGVMTALENNFTQNRRRKIKT
jgi:hypothetical protein